MNFSKHNYYNNKIHLYALQAHEKNTSKEHYAILRSSFKE